jgi:predicted nucleic acid-binding protein
VGSSPLTKLDDALAGVTALAFDTAPFIYFVERHPAYVDLVREIFRRVDAGAIAGYSSAITLTEVLTKPKQTGDAAIADAYRRILLGGRNFTLLPIDRAVAEIAADVRARYRLRTPDALQVAAGMIAGCEALVTNDSTLSRVTAPPVFRVLVLDELEL